MADGDWARTAYDFLVLPIDVPPKKNQIFEREQAVGDFTLQEFKFWGIGFPSGIIR